MSFRKNILVSYSSQIVSVICSFLASILATRMLGDKGQGEYALYINFILLSTLVIGIGLPAAIVHFIASGKLAKNKLFSFILMVLGVGACTISLFMFLFHTNTGMTIFLPDVVLSSSIWMVFLILHLVFITTNAFLSSILQAENKFHHAGYITILGTSTILLLYALKYYFNVFAELQILSWLIISMVFSASLQIIFYLFEIFKIDKNYFSFTSVKLSTFKPLLQFAFLAFATNLIQFFSLRMDIWFVHFYHGKELTGVYALAVSLSQLIWLLPSALQAVLFTFISTHSDQYLNLTKTLQSTKQIALYAILAGLGGYLLSFYLVVPLFGNAFQASIQCIGILLIGIVPFCLSMPISGYFVASGRVRFNLFSAIIGFVICLIADILLIPQYGIQGAAYASVISYLSTVIFLGSKFYKDYTSIISKF